MIGGFEIALIVSYLLISGNGSLSLFKDYHFLPALSYLLPAYYYYLLILYIACFLLYSVYFALSKPYLYPT